MWEGTDLMPKKKSKSQENDYVPPSEKDLAKRFWDKQQVEKIKAQEKTSPEEKEFNEPDNENVKKTPPDAPYWDKALGKMKEDIKKILPDEKWQRKYTDG